MKIKSTLAGIIVASALFAAGPSQAAYSTVCTNSLCGTWDVGDGFAGTGWQMVPCHTELQTAVTWQQYSSGSYLPPTVRKNNSFLGL